MVSLYGLWFIYTRPNQLKPGFQTPSISANHSFQLIFSGTCFSIRATLVDLVKHLDNPQLKAQAYIAIAESLLQDSKNFNAARKSLQEAYKIAVPLNDLPTLIEILRIRSRTSLCMDSICSFSQLCASIVCTDVCSQAIVNDGSHTNEQEQRSVASQLREKSDEYAARWLSACQLPQASIIDLLQ